MDFFVSFISTSSRTVFLQLKIVKPDTKLILFKKYSKIYD